MSVSKGVTYQSLEEPDNTINKSLVVFFEYLLCLKCWASIEIWLKIQPSLSLISFTKISHGRWKLEMYFSSCSSYQVFFSKHWALSNTLNSTKFCHNYQAKCHIWNTAYDSLKVKLLATSLFPFAVLWKVIRCSKEIIFILLAFPIGDTNSLSP